VHHWGHLIQICTRCFILPDVHSFHRRFVVFRLSKEHLFAWGSRWVHVVAYHRASSCSEGRHLQRRFEFGVLVDEVTLINMLGLLLLLIPAVHLFQVSSKNIMIKECQHLRITNAHLDSLTDLQFSMLYEWQQL
jgi:hypothetical protein